MATYSDAQIAQLIADHAALKDEVAALKKEMGQQAAATWAVVIDMVEEMVYSRVTALTIAGKLEDEVFKFGEDLTTALKSRRRDVKYLPHAGTLISENEVERISKDGPEVAALKVALRDCVEGWLKGNDVVGPMQRASALLRKYA